MSETTADKKPKVLILINELWVGGGAEKTTAQLANYLHNNDYEVNVVVLYDGEQLHQVDCPYTALGEAPKGKFDKLLRLPKNILRIKRLILTYQPDKVICFLEEASFTTLLSQKISRKKTSVIVSVRNNLFALSKLYQILSKYLYRSAEKIVCVTKRIEHDLKERFGFTNTCVIYNGVDVEYALQKSKEPLSESHAAIFSRGPVAIAVGRLAPQKGYDVLLEAFAQVVESVKNAQLVIVGEGPLHQQLKDQAVSLGVSQQVHFLGKQKNVYNLLAAANVYVLSSYFEGMPNTMLEALAVGLPVVATDCVSGPREILAPELGVNESVTYPFDVGTHTLVQSAIADTDRPLATKQIFIALEYVLKQHFTSSSDMLEIFTSRTSLTAWQQLLDYTR